MHYKTINLKNDEIFKRCIPLNEGGKYPPLFDDQNLSRSTIEMAHRVRETICDLVIQGKLDAIDLKIIAARDCSPMPSNRKVANTLNISRRTVDFKVARLKLLFNKHMH